jgi:hypothetical protein
MGSIGNSELISQPPELLIHMAYPTFHGKPECIPPSPVVQT